jgi:hypothetical protein
MDVALSFDRRGRHAERRRSASTVIEVSVQQPFISLPDSIKPIRVNGEAVAVDLGPAGMIFALLRSRDDVDNAAHIVWKSFPKPGGPGGEAAADGLRYYHALRGSTRVPLSAVPMLVRFSNIDDPKTVAMVDSFGLAATLGPGVRLAEIVITMVPAGAWPFNSFGLVSPQFLTGVPLSSEIDRRLIWLEQWRQRGGSISGRTFFDKPPRLEEILLYGDFKRDKL